MLGCWVVPFFVNTTLITRGRDNLNGDAVLLRFATNDRDPDFEVVLAFIVRLRNDVCDIGAGTVIMP